MPAEEADVVAAADVVDALFDDPAQKTKRGRQTLLQQIRQAETGRP